MMPILLLLLLALISQLEHWPPPDLLGNAGSLLVALFVLGGIWLVGHVFTSYVCRLLRRKPDEVRRIVRRVHSWETIYLASLVVLYFLTLYFSGLGYWIRQIWFNELALVTPLFMALACSWARFYALEKTAHDIEEEGEKGRTGEPENGRAEPREGPDTSHQPAPHGARLAHSPLASPFISRWGYVVLQARFNLMFIVPPLLLLPVFRTISWLVPETDENGFFLALFSVVFLGLTMLSIPWLLRFFLGLKPLPRGPMREQLEAVARRLSFRCSDILVWHTHRSSANAMVTGLLPWGRFIVLTDRLLNDLSTEEVEAVVGHEIGHVKHHHMYCFAVFLMISVFALGLLFGPKKLLLSDNDNVPLFLGDYVQELLVVLGKLSAVAAYLYFVFGWLSRSCERQADLFGACAVSAEAFVSALEKVAYLNGIPREHPGWFSSWRHPPIARRVEFVIEMEQHPELAKRFHRRLSLVKWSMTAALVGILGLTAWLGNVVR